MLTVALSYEETIQIIVIIVRGKHVFILLKSKFVPWMFFRFACIQKKLIKIYILREWN